MKKAVYESDFIDAFKTGDTYKDSFSYAGLRALYEYLTEYEDSIGEETELDVVALCCDFSEYESAWDAMQEHQPDDMPTVEDTGVDENGRGMDLVELGEAQEKLALEWLEARTTVITFDGGIIIQQF